MHIYTRLIGASLTWLAGIAAAHDLPPPPKLFEPGARAALSPYSRRAATPTGEGRLPVLQAVVVIAAKWNTGSTLRTCFFGGTPEVRTRIAAIATEWTQYANLKLDFGGPNPRSCTARDDSAIRIGFDEPGNWSYIGRASLDPRLRGMSTMNFSEFDSNPPPDSVFVGTVLHEFGHALGFHHEHQSPLANCDAEFAWEEWIYPTFQDAGWNRDKVDQNMRALKDDSSAFEISATVDRLSIMHYALDPRMFKRPDSPCRIAANNSISELDKLGAMRAYPRGSAEIRNAQALEFRIMRGVDGSPQLDRDAAALVSSKLRALKADVNRTPD
jgi:hypothetical protein